MSPIAFHDRVVRALTHLIADRVLPVVVIVTLGACATPSPHALDTGIKKLEVTDVQAERDRIYTLLAYAVVLKDWQSNRTPELRGHNIGSVLVDPQGQVVFWARNCKYVTRNATQHGEVRLIRNYLHQIESSELNGHTVYTTLEPCAMCSGMMVLTEVYRTVYGQSDPEFGNTLERLSLDSTSLAHGHPRYPISVISEPSDSKFYRQLDASYQQYTRNGGTRLTHWLRSKAAHAIYQAAWNEFHSMEAQHAENRPILERARAFLLKVPAHYTPLPR